MKGLWIFFAVLGGVFLSMFIPICAEAFHRKRRNCVCVTVCVCPASPPGDFISKYCPVHNAEPKPNFWCWAKKHTNWQT
jgi:hypothetical protein